MIEKKEAALEEGGTKQGFESGNYNIIPIGTQSQDISSDWVYKHFQNVKIVDDGFLLDCPFCQDKKQHGKIFKSSRGFKCFKCGDAKISDVSQRLGIPDPWTQAKKPSFGPTKKTNSDLYKEGTLATAGNPYLARKQIQPTAAVKQNGVNLLIPMYKNGEFLSVQKITPSGDKYFEKDKKTTGLFHIVGETTEDTEKITLTEGYANAVTVYQSTGIPTAACFSAGNLKHCTQELKAKFPKAKFSICADVEIPDDGQVPPGKKGATAAAKVYGWPIVYPTDKQEKLDFNDLMIRDGVEAVRKIVFDGFEHSIIETNSVIGNQTTADDLFSLYENDKGVVPGHNRIVFDIADKDENLKNLVYTNVLTGNIQPTTLDTLEEVEIFIKNYFSKKYFCELTNPKTISVIQRIAQNNKVNPMLDFYSALPKTEKNHLSTFLSFYKINAPENLVLEMFDKFLTEMFFNIIAASFRFEYVNDRVFILQGNQGVGKGRTCVFLAGSFKLYLDLSVSGSLNDKDVLSLISGKAIAEFSELEGMRKAKAEALKSFLSKTRDEYRPPYARANVLIPRTVSFIGTTNAKSYLNDPTGARRFYPLEILEIDSSVFDMQDLRQNILSFYFNKALNAFNTENFQAEINKVKENSPELNEYLDEIRIEKFTESIYDTDIERYINAIEAGDWTSFPERCKIADYDKYITANEAAKFLFTDVERTPKNFLNIFAIIATGKGYKNAGKVMKKGRRLRVWEKS